MGAYVEPDRALVLEVAPGRDDDLVVAADGLLGHQIHVAEQVSVEHGPHQPVHRVAAVVLGGGEDRTGGAAA
ncbi:MAG TPA: hypothetical protein VIM10_15625 [Actinopolymorphaceae bacterium]